MAGFVFTAEDFAGALTADEHDIMLGVLRKPHLRSVRPRSADRLRQLFVDACDVLAQSPGIALDTLRVSAMTRDITAGLASALAFETDERGEPLRPSRRSHIVSQARELAAQGRDGSALTVEDLCRSLGVSRRALQYCFLETVGIRPSAYLRAVRLNGARRSIKHAASVADAAALWGFWHFGRFAHDYKTMFGELPSEAFRRFHPSKSPPVE